MTTMDPGVENWLRLAEHELRAAGAMRDAGQNLYVVFTCHQAAEKALKAALAHQTGAHPPRTHDLVRLAALVGPDCVPAGLTGHLAYLNESFMDVRYPTDLEEAAQRFPMATVLPLIANTEVLLQWVRSRLKSEK
jgi:HEPN domain-containing protein